MSVVLDPVLKATQVAFSDSQLLARVQQALQPYRPIVLLMPAPDGETAVCVLDERRYVFYDGVELAEQLGRPQVSLDDIRWDYYKEIGYDKAVQQEIREREGLAGVYRYWKRFEAHAVVRAVQDHHGCVMDFGAGHSVQENATDFARIQAVLAPYSNIVLLLPSPDLDEAITLLRERTPFKVGGVPFTRYLITHAAFHRLATQVVYTGGKTPEAICEEILGE